MKKKSSCFTWLIIIVIVLVVFDINPLDYFDTDQNTRTDYPDTEDDYAEEAMADDMVDDGPSTSYVSVQPKRQPYYPLKNCAASRLYVGDRAFVSLGGGSNGIRTEPDTKPSDNIIGRAPSGEGMWIIGGPECNYGWILWKVDTDSGLVGWTPETKDGKEFWLVPVDSPEDVASEFGNDTKKRTAYQEASQIMADTRLSESEKRDRMRVLQRNYGEETVAWVMRFVPVYDADDKRFYSFDTYMRDFSSDYGSPSSGAPIEKDPVGAGLKIFFDPSTDTITDMLGLDDW
jgi:hypothetical protein